MPGRPCPAEPNDFPTLELTEPPVTPLAVPEGDTEAGPPSVKVMAAAGKPGSG
jgi:hypothetical protein